MKKKKICVVVASRANYGRVKSLLVEIKKSKKLELQLILSASAILKRFGNVLDIVKKDGFKPDSIVYTVVEGEDNYPRIILIKFPSYEKALEWYHSEDYKPIKDIRLQNSKGLNIIVKGI